MTSKDAAFSTPKIPVGQAYPFCGTRHVFRSGETGSRSITGGNGVNDFLVLLPDLAGEVFLP